MFSNSCGGEKVCRKEDIYQEGSRTIADGIRKSRAFNIGKIFRGNIYAKHKACLLLSEALYSVKKKKEGQIEEGRLWHKKKKKKKKKTQKNPQKKKGEDGFATVPPRDSLFTAGGGGTL